MGATHPPFSQQRGPKHSPNTINYPHPPPHFHQKPSNIHARSVWSRLATAGLREKMSHNLTWQAHIQQQSQRLLCGLSRQNILECAPNAAKHAYQWKSRVTAPTHRLITHCAGHTWCSVIKMCVFDSLPAVARRMI